MMGQVCGKNLFFLSHFLHALFTWENTHFLIKTKFGELCFPVLGLLTLSTGTGQGGQPHLLPWAPGQHHRSHEGSSCQPPSFCSPALLSGWQEALQLLLTQQSSSSLDTPPCSPGIIIIYTNCFWSTLQPQRTAWREVGYCAISKVMQGSTATS